MDIEKSVELKHLRSVCEIQKRYIDGEISEETYKKQIDDANCVYKFYLESLTEKFRLEKSQTDMAVLFSNLLSGKLLSEEKSNGKQGCNTSV